MSNKDNSLQKLYTENTTNLWHILHNVEAIQTAARHATVGHDSECPCATCKLEKMATAALEDARARLLPGA